MDLGIQDNPVHEEIGSWLMNEAFRLHMRCEV